jgi:hypothetical protein
VNFPFICSNIPAVPAYWVYLSQLIRYSRACGSYQDFLDKEITKPRIILWKDIIYVAESEIKGSF